MIKIIDYREDNKWTVYIHTNKINNKQYIGITSTSVWKRWGTHGIHYKPYDGTKSKFWNAIVKYGFDSFDHDIFAEDLTKDEACKIEILLIDKLKTQNDNYGYNILSGGDGVNGHNPSKGKNHYLSKQIYQYDISLNLIKKWDCISDLKRNINCFSQFLLERSKQEKRLYLDSFWCDTKIESKNIGQYDTLDIEWKTPIFQYDLDGNLIEAYYSLQEVVDKNKGYTLRNVSNAYNHITTSYMGYIWSEITDADFIRYLIMNNMFSHKMSFIPISQFDKDGKLIHSYSSAIEIEKITGFKANKIYDNCIGRIKSSQGFIWRFNMDYFNKLELDSSFLFT